MFSPSNDSWVEKRSLTEEVSREPVFGVLTLTFFIELHNIKNINKRDMSRSGGVRHQKGEMKPSSDHSPRHSG